MFNMTKIGSNISQLRKRANMTQMELADKMGISFQAVSNWERGQTCPDISKLGELSGILGCTIDELLGNKRAAEVIEAINADKPLDDVTPAELADVAPILKPEQVDRNLKKMMSLNDKISSTIGRIIGKFSGEVDEHIEDIEEMIEAEVERTIESHFGPGESEDEPADEPAEKKKNLGGFFLDDIIQLAPFVSQELISEMVHGAVTDGCTISDLAAIAPFVDSDVLGEVARDAVKKNGGSINELTSIAPFIDDDVLGEIVRDVMKTGGSIDSVTAIAPFIDEDVFGEIVKDALARGCDPNEFVGVLPFLGEDAVGALALAAIEKNGLNAIMPFMPFVDDDLIAEQLRKLRNKRK